MKYKIIKALRGHADFDVAKIAAERHIENLEKEISDIRRTITEEQMKMHAE